MRITYIKIHQNKGNEIPSSIPSDPRYDGRPPRAPLPSEETIRALEFLRDDDPRLTAQTRKFSSIQFVTEMPCFKDLNEEDLIDLMNAKAAIQKFMTECAYELDSFKGEFDRLSERYNRVMAARHVQAEAERKAQEEADARADLKAIRETLEKNASLAKKEAGAGVKGILKTLDPIVVAIINNHQMSTKEKLIELRSTDKKFCGYSNVDMGDLLGVSGQRITQILTEMDKEAKKAKKEAENRIDEKFVDDRRRPQ